MGTWEGQSLRYKAGEHPRQGTESNAVQMVRVVAQAQRGWSDCRGALGGAFLLGQVLEEPRGRS